MRHLLLLLSLFALAACSSEEPTPEPAPEVAAAPAPQAQPKPKAKPKAEKRRRRRTRKGKRGKRRKRPTLSVPEGHLYLAFNKADLKSQVLPAIEAQAGVKITWLGSRRQITLPLKRSLPFAEAMDLICRFSDTHLVRAYSGRYELRDGYQGQLDSEGLTLDTSGGASGGSSRKKGKRARGRPVARGKARRKGRAPSSSNDGWRDTYDAAAGRRTGNQAKGILRDMGTRSTGNRGR
jgi:predicted small lipoprotein YifL